MASLAYLNIHSFTDIYNSNAMVKAHIKEFATVALLLFLLATVFIAVFLIYGFNKDKKWCQTLLISLMVFLSLGALGTFYAPYRKYEFFQISGVITPESFGQVIGIAQFKDMNAINEEFKNYLKQAELGQIHCYIASHLVYNGEKVPIKINRTLAGFDKENILLTTDFIKAFTHNPSLRFEFDLKPDQQLVQRDLGNLIHKIRDDQIFINKEKQTLLFDKSLLIYFKFETLDGKPIAVFL